MARLNALLTGGILGAGAMYFLDPQQGKRRLALIEGQCRRLSRETTEGFDAAWRDLGNRARGTVAEPGIHAFTKWTPGTRLLAGSIGAMLIGNCLARRDMGSMLLGTIGFGVAMCALAGSGTHTPAVGGKHRRATGSLHGSGAPAGDARTSQPHGLDENVAWPPSSWPVPQPAEPTGHFPPAV